MSAYGSELLFCMNAIQSIIKMRPTMAKLSQQRENNRMMKYFPKMERDIRSTQIKVQAASKTKELLIQLSPHLTQLSV